jgi:hypothetical protein
MGSLSLWLFTLEDIFQINSRTHPKEYGGRGSAQNTAKKAKLKA